MEEVKEEEAINYAKEKNIIFSLTSSYDNTGVNELFYQLAQKYLYSYHKGIIKKEVKDTNRIILNNDTSINENNGNNNINNKKCCRKN